MEALQLADELSGFPPHKIAHALGCQLRHDYHRQGSSLTLRCSVLNLQTALDLAPRDDLDWYRYAVALSEAHRIKYEGDANERDLLRTLELNWEAISAVFPGQSAHIHYA
jgi:hypothetical protein